MILSKTEEYAIKAAVFIAHKSLQDERTNLKEISEEIDSPEAFTAKILQTLVRHRIINSVKGAGGGFSIVAQMTKKIKLIDIVVALDPLYDKKGCVLGLSHCSEVNPCPIHHKYKPVKAKILELLRKTSLFELSENYEKGLSYLKN